MASTRRSPALPDLLTTGEFGYPNLLAENWYCLVGPAGLPQPVVARLSEAARKASETREVREGLAAQGAEATWTSQEDFAAYVRSEAEKWKTIAERAGVRTD